MRFSERHRHRPTRDAMQVADIDEPLRNRLWSTFADTVPDLPVSLFSRSWAYDAYCAIWRDFLKLPVDETPHESWRCRKEMKAWFLDSEWYDIYSFIEFLVQLNPAGRGVAFRDSVNTVLEAEMAGYRVIGETVTPITDEQELAAIRDALAATDDHRLAPVRIHLEAAIAKLSDRSAPDYRNSIKESISAIESLAAILVGADRIDLSAALRTLEAKTAIHGALRAGFLSLYGWTSDDNGIRHALLDEPTLDFADAKFMAVSCAAFVHYLVYKAASQGLLEVNGRGDP